MPFALVDLVASVALRTLIFYFLLHYCCVCNMAMNFFLCNFPFIAAFFSSYLLLFLFLTCACLCVHRKFLNIDAVINLLTKCFKWNCVVNILSIVYYCLLISFFAMKCTNNNLLHPESTLMLGTCNRCELHVCLLCCNSCSVIMPLASTWISCFRRVARLSICSLLPWNKR